LKALDAMESAEWAVSESDGAVEEAAPEPAAHDSPEPELTRLAPVGVEIAGADFLGGSSVADQPSQVDSSSETHTAAPVESPQLRTSSASAPSPCDPNIKPLRVIEACLFVGGQPLSAKKLAGLLDGNNEASDIETLIDELNLEYAAQGRPYEIRLVDGGYKLTLRAEFEAIRSRVYGVGPRDVKLSQDVLEVLALVAYQQPINQAAVEACKPNSANILRQLLRRELISLNRVDQSRKGVEYQTTPRFLQLFGLAQLNELPRPEDLSVR
jgi:segregation and condensation protein B